MAKRVTGCLLLGLGAVLLCGCPAENYPDTVPSTLRDINLIVNNTDLTLTQRRAKLAELGLSAEIINVLFSTERTANQFGGDLRTAYDKVVAGRLLDLTPDEVQLYGDGASAADTTLSITLTDAEAQAIVSFFDDLHITTSASLEAYLDTPDAAVPDTIPDGVLKSLFVDFDPQLLLPNLP